MEWDLEISGDSEAYDGVSAIGAAADSISHDALTIDLHPASSAYATCFAGFILVPAPLPDVAAHIVDSKFIWFFCPSGCAPAFEFFSCQATLSGLSLPLN